MKVQVQVQPQQQLQEPTSQQQSVQQNTEQQIVQVCVFIIPLCCGNRLNLFNFILAPLKFSIYFQVQIQGQHQGQMLGQVLQVPSGSHQQLQGVTTAQLIQPGELTEEQHQQVHLRKHAQTHTRNIMAEL